MFSIIMPYYKNDKVVHRSIESVLKQTIDDFELIIVDDGSNDNIFNIVEQFRDARLKLFQKENEGVSKTRNFGIHVSKGEWICFLDSDDSWESNHLSTLSYLISKYKHVNYFCTAHSRFGAKTFHSSLCYPQDFPQDFICNDLIGLALNFGEIIHTNSICINRKILLKTPLFDTSSCIGEDTDLWYRLGAKNPIVLSKVATTNYFRDASFLTKNNNYNYEWPFLKRRDLLDDSSISIEIKCSIKRIWVKTILSNCKHMISNGEKKEAKKLFLSLSKEEKMYFRKSSKQVSFLLKMPSCLSKEVTRFIYRRQFKKY